MVNETETHSQSGGVPPAKHPGHFPWKIVLVILLIGGVVAYAMVKRQPGGVTAGKGPGGAGGKGGGMGSNLPVAAVVGVVQTKNVPIYLDGIGTAQAFNTVTVRSRVDGNITNINFDEGQDVHAGDVLAQLDPDPFKTVVKQA